MALPSLDDRAIARLGWTATLGSIAMYVSISTRSPATCTATRDR
ncbi:hypothetical protein [Sphingomonas gellani]|nr:hypothetical protein [Sphingomonas gellani]